MVAAELQPVKTAAFGEICTHEIDQNHPLAVTNAAKLDEIYRKFSRHDSDLGTSTESTKSVEHAEAANDLKRKRTFWMKLKAWILENLILIFTLLGVIVGVVLGIILKSVEASHGKISAEWKTVISFPGDVLMRSLKCLIVPLVSASLVSGLGQLDLSLSAKMARRAFIYYFGTNVMAVILGIIVVVVIHPGSPAVKSSTYEILDDAEKHDSGLSTLDAMLDLLRNLFTDNIVQTAFMFDSTVYNQRKVKVQISENEMRTMQNISGVFQEVNNKTGEVSRHRIETRTIPSLEHKYGVNMLGLIIFFLIFGFVLTSIKDDSARIVTQFFSCVNDVIMKMIVLVMWFSPIGIGSLIAGRIIATDQLLVLLASLARLVGAVVAGLAIHMLIILPAIFFITTRRNPYTFMKGMFQAWLIGFATASSAASIPFSLRCLEVNNKIDSRVSRFVVPVGATINMNGTALYEAVATIFIGQVNNMPMPFMKLVTISVTATLAAIGAAAVPGAGLVTLIIVLSSVGLPVQDVSLVVAVDWLLDRFRTSVNVMDDSVGAGIVYYMSKNELDAMDAEVTAKAAAAVSKEEAFVTPTVNAATIIHETAVASYNGTPVPDGLVHRRGSRTASVGSKAETRC